MHQTTFQGAKIQEQGVTFAIVSVQPYVLANPDKTEANRIIASFQLRVFPGVPVILMAQDPRNIPTYYGRHDIARFLSTVPAQNIPWQHFTINE